MERRYGEPSKTRNDSGAEFNRGGVAGDLMVHAAVVSGGCSSAFAAGGERRRLSQLPTRSGHQVFQLSSGAKRVAHCTGCVDVAHTAQCPLVIARTPVIPHWTSV
jgi:hypothetical protein